MGLIWALGVLVFFVERQSIGFFYQINDQKEALERSSIGVEVKVCIAQLGIIWFKIW